MKEKYHPAKIELEKANEKIKYLENENQKIISQLHQLRRSSNRHYIMSCHLADRVVELSERLGTQGLLDLERRRGFIE